MKHTWLAAILTLFIAAQANATPTSPEISSQGIENPAFDQTTPMQAPTPSDHTAQAAPESGKTEPQAASGDTTDVDQSTPMTTQKAWWPF
ncbi:MAG: hypothetical protein COS82_02200 [Zetaproteobacteria bacterium CG06_land_8_20_14_3_00_59_53]|nr:MAG: hypothetical protein AUK36_10225 [Zetaproteobacteria bacterium CG2_30_59_37]PIO89737.1 MAG: hypothetical protein COX56_06160 [Zetaproteobacteria bacterium CG23_combo_of_CG06-09_8_20_14_all_59_86]PIQ63989.1 MAG: hypothetical protein COV97_11510 [Zetaproteobacteria bacterium CG11_big_fil_rev_8_21_14_0_20_59_439]PIU71208.1 MAG: hypothetical protein COS82_02200 [Zetaproteobacteria bacterium CG06_land_8_20_14_3_00_59_53]PIU96205.1 MAG: hypothetical protein COS62_10010 [Zetaproteobacteria bac